ncbi:PQQ-binding-like beta-propeller repeat protein [Haloarcula salinisoli]|uniref:PQQ-like beta-propeller repeat protein n=1 Tax=Haloarcula salinisoli TaxID=2487746 RepID=A0A8J7YJH9_9EURY|nr:PQQ-binding-like beta-propeller repeat protein [Halomicroarcula salinisoli]MBX0303874.1 PQQ-like beta-propeller repeat protein [Halomicroarcula salinisoli]
MRRRTYVALVGSASLAGCVGRLGETERQTDSVDFQKLWETGLEDDDGPIWAFRATGDGETAYLGTKSELTALSLEDGTEQWALPLDTYLGGVTIDDDGLFILYSNTMQRIDPDTGESRWTTTADKSTGYSLVATTDEHVAVSGAGAVFVFEKESGQQTAQPTEADGNSVRAWDGQFVVAEDSAVTAYDPDGTAQWTVDDVSLNWLTPVVGSTVVGGGNGTFVGIDLEGGTQAWTTEVSGRLPHAKTATTDDTVFVYPWGGGATRPTDTFYALSADTGAVRWKEGDTDSYAFPPVVLESGIVFDGADRPQAYEHETGRQIDSIDTGGGWRGATGSGRTVVMYGTRAVAYRL